MRRFGLINERLTIRLTHDIEYQDLVDLSAAAKAKGYLAKAWML